MLEGKTRTKCRCGVVGSGTRKRIRKRKVLAVQKALVLAASKAFLEPQVTTQILKTPPRLILLHLPHLTLTVELDSLFEIIVPLHAGHAEHAGQWFTSLFFM